MAWKTWFWSTISGLSLVTYVGFFGQQAIRMLRESWEGIVPVTTDPVSQQQQVRPVGADLLAQELFSVLNDNTPQTQNAPITINQSAGADGLKINSSGNSSDPSVLHVTSGNITLAGTGTISVGTSSTSITTGSTVVLQGSNLVIPPIGQIPLAATTYDPLSPTQLPTINLATLGNAYPGQVYMGKVTAHLSGSDYTVQLAGLTSSVTATAPSLGVGFTVPNNTYYPVVVVDDGTGGVLYEFQPYPFAPIAISGARQSAASGGGITNLLAGLATNNLITNSTTDSPQSVSGNYQDLSSSGGLAHLATAMSNLGYISSSLSSSPPTINGFIGSVASGGGIYNLLAGLANYSMITNSTTTSAPSVTGARNDGGATIPALTNLLTALANLGYITDNTTP